MTITVAFTLTAGLAICVNSFFLRSALLRARALGALGQNGALAAIAAAFIQIWITMLAVEVLMLMAGIGVLSGHPRPFGYLLAAIPVAHVMYGLFAVTGFRSRH